MGKKQVCLTSIQKLNSRDRKESTSWKGWGYILKKRVKGKEMLLDKKGFVKQILSKELFQNGEAG